MELIPPHTKRKKRPPQITYGSVTAFPLLAVYTHPSQWIRTYSLTVNTHLYPLLLISIYTFSHRRNKKILQIHLHLLNLNQQSDRGYLIYTEGHYRTSQFLITR